MSEFKVGGYTDGDGGTLKATVNGHPASFDGEVWTCLGDQKLAHNLTSISRTAKRATIDATAENALRLLVKVWTIDSFTRDREYHIALNLDAID